MKITVITVSRNSGATIADTVKSVRAQGYPNYEHLIVDGASTDETLNILNGLRHENLRVISEPDRGLYDAMNKGIGLATGELIGFLNADDFFCRSDALSCIAAAATTHADAAAISSGIAIVERDRPDRIRRDYRASSFRQWMLRFGHMPPHPGFYARSSAFNTVGGFDLNLKIASDFNWMVRFFYGHKLVAVPLPETIVAMRDGGLSTRDLHSTMTINAEARQSLAKYGVWTSPPLMWLKYAFKIGQYNARGTISVADNIRWRPDSV